jgi:putative endonuclease
MYTIYGLISQKRNWIYVGMTSDLEDRIRRHQKGYEKTTKPFRPFIIVELAVAFNSSEARRIEKWYKTAYGKNCIKQLLLSTEPPFHGGITGLSADR